MRKTLTIEHHMRLAGHLRNIARDIRAIHKIVSGYRLVSRIGRRLFAAELKVLELKSSLEDVMFRDHDGDARCTPAIYYGNPEAGDGR